MRLLQYWKAREQEQWASGKFTDQQQFATAIMNAKAVGKCEVLDQLRQLDYERFVSEVEDAEHFWLDSGWPSRAG